MSETAKSRGPAPAAAAHPAAPKIFTDPGVTVFTMDHAQLKANAAEARRLLQLARAHLPGLASLTIDDRRLSTRQARVDPASRGVTPPRAPRRAHHLEKCADGLDQCADGLISGARRPHLRPRRRPEGASRRPFGDPGCAGVG